MSVEAVSRAKLRRDVWEQLLISAWAPHVYVFCARGEGEASFRARMFAPAMGIEEDPATGAAATAFGGYLAALQSAGEGEWLWRIEQGIEMGRPSTIILRVSRDGSGKLTICVCGHIVIVSEGDFYLKR